MIQYTLFKDSIFVEVGLLEMDIKIVVYPFLVPCSTSKSSMKVNSGV